MEKEKTKIIKNIKRQVCFIYLSFRIAFTFCFGENVLSLPMWLVTTVLFDPVGKRSKSHSQMFCKIDTLKNLFIFTGKHLCWRFFLTAFIKKRHQHRCFPVNIGKCFSTAFYIEHIPFFSYFS